MDEALGSYPRGCGFESHLRYCHIGAATGSEQPVIGLWATQAPEQGVAGSDQPPL